jgi:hypothetical protein
LLLWAITPANHKEYPDEYSIESCRRVFRPFGGLTRFNVSDSTVLLVRASRIVGEPLDLSRTCGRGRGISVRLFDKHDSSPRQNAWHVDRPRDRSILFWKSMPVSDRTTVLAKASIPLVIVPLLACATAVVAQFIMLLLSSAALLASGLNVSPLWTELSFFRMSLLLLYHIFTAHTLWPAPVYCWLLLVSGWARRATLLWAALPVVAIGGLEAIVFRTWHFAALVGTRLIGAAPAIDFGSPDTFPTNPMTHITPLNFLSSPELWLGLALSAAFLAAAVRLRRYQGPV